jgi:hypothetical protein
MILLRHFHIVTIDSVYSPPVCGDKTTPIRNDCIAWLGSIVGSWVQVPAIVDLRHTDYIQWGQA